MKITDIKIQQRYRKEMGDISELAKNIEKIGLLHPIVVNHESVLIAGMRRLNAVISLGWDEVPVTIINLDKIIEGEFSENVHRKDFLPSEAVQIKKALEPLEKEKAKERQGTRTDILCGNLPQGRTRDKVALAVGMGERNLKKAEEIVDSGNTDIIEEMDRTGNINMAYNKFLRKKMETKFSEALPLPDGKFDVIMADPPWRYMTAVSNRQVENHYPTMELEDICATVPPSADDCVLFLWATASKLREAFTVLEKWGFEYKTGGVWDKEKIGMGYYFRGQHELILVGRKGNPGVPLPENRYSSVIREKRTEHSKKPEIIYDMIEKMYPNRNYLEMFARKKHNEKWSVWGNEI